MPVVIAPNRVDDWLRAPPADVVDLIAPAADEALVTTAVSRRVNTVKNDDPGCLAPAKTDPLPAAERQRTLF
jgi:putative SOS response-associated peptidase YedK